MVAGGAQALAEGIGTDIAFQDDKAFVGNYDGFSIIDVRNPKKPKTIVQVKCPGSQNDITVSGDLLYLSTDSSRSDDSCASTSQPATVSLARPPGQEAGSARSRSAYWLSVTPLNSWLNEGTLKPVL